MVDTSRHFLPLNALRRQIDGMSYNKMNALHWHLTDAQSTPFDSAVYPDLKLGAFSAKAVYTPTDIKQIVEYARLRGVQVLMEMDMPGHSFSFGIGYPELIVRWSCLIFILIRKLCARVGISLQSSAVLATSSGHELPTTNHCTPAMQH
jgi:N-acetyl-beta-hexosaminidase